MCCVRGEISALRTTSELSAIRNTGEIQATSIDTFEEPSDLHAIITGMKKFHSTSTSSAIYEHSERQLKVHTELGDLSRLRFLSRTLQTKTACQGFSSPCQNCGKSELVHLYHHYKTSLSLESSLEENRLLQARVDRNNA